MARTKGDGGPSMMEMVRTSLDELGWDAKPTALQEHIKAKYDKEISKIIISNYKSTMSKKKGSGSGKKRRGRPTGSTKAVAAPSSGGKGIHLEDFATIHKLVSRLGARQVRELVDVLA